MTTVFLNTHKKDKENDLSDLLNHWGHNTAYFNNPDSAWTLLSSDNPPEIILFYLNAENDESIEFLKVLWELRHEFPFHSILYGEEKNKENLYQALGQYVHDVIIDIDNEQLLKAKIEVAKQAVIDRRSIAQSSQIMERYARYADKVAMEKTRQLSHAERLSTLGTMSAGLAHEINNPIGYISTSLETAQIYWKQLDKILSNGKLDGDNSGTDLEKIRDRVPKAFERISTGLSRIDKLIKSLKNFARASKGEKAEKNINECVKVALEMCESTVKYHVTVNLELKEDLPTVLIEPQQIEQVLINLLVNAADALEGKPDAEINISTDRVEDYIQLIVSDNGPGIPKSKLDTIWEPYYTTKAEGKGTGLGLAIVKSLIKDNKGKISVRNKETGGAEFTIRFPFDQK